ESNDRTGAIVPPSRSASGSGCVMWNGLALPPTIENSSDVIPVSRPVTLNGSVPVVPIVTAPTSSAPLVSPRIESGLPGSGCAAPLILNDEVGAISASDVLDGAVTTTSGVPDVTVPVSVRARLVT